MSEPFSQNKIDVGIYGDKRIIKGEIVALLNITFQDRGLRLIEPKSRALRRHEIHELMITDEIGSGPGSIVDRVSAIAFFEITLSGLAVIGDRVSVGEKFLGKISGYDLTHMPNHINILVKSESLSVPEIRVGDEIEIIKG
jgi:hypothetical protein